MRKYIAPHDIASFFIGGNYFRVEDGILTVPDGIDVDVQVRQLGFTDAPAEAVATKVKPATVKGAE